MYKMYVRSNYRVFQAISCGNVVRPSSAAPNISIYLCICIYYIIMVVTCHIKALMQQNDKKKVYKKKTYINRNV